MSIQTVVKQFFLWRENRVWTWIEAIAITFLVLFFCHLINPGNFLFMKEIFPWPWIAAVIIVLQYGFGPGILSVAIISAAAIVQRDSGVISAVDFQAYILSGVTVTLVCALFSSSWVRRMINAEELSQYIQERLNSLSRSYYMLRISYDYLENNVITQPITLRSAIDNIQKIVITEHGKINADIAYRFLQLINQYCSTTIVGFYLFENKRIRAQPIAEIGTVGELIIDDPLIVKCLDAEEISYVTVNQLEDISDCKYLVAAPLSAKKGELLGIIVVKEMSFWNLNHDNLRAMSILVSYFTQGVIVTKDAADFLHVYPSCTSEFAMELMKLVSLKRLLNIDSAFAAVLVSKELRAHNVMFNLKNKKRFVDSIWCLEIGNYDVLITLMPFTNAAGILGYTIRIQDFLKLDLGLAVDNKKITIRSLQLYVDKPLNIMRYFLDFIGGENSAN